MNHQRLKIALMLMLALGYTGTHAKEGNPIKSASLFSAQSVGGVLVLSLMGSAVTLSGWEGKGGLLNSSKSSPQPAHAKVTQVQEREDGSREVELVGPAVAEKEGEVHARVLFPKQVKTEQAQVVVGDTVDLVPSKGSSGWLVHKKDGVALGFLPAPQVMQDASSERF